MSRGMKISLGLIAVFIGLSLIGVIFGRGVTNPLPQTEDREFSIPNNMVFVAPTEHVRQVYDEENKKTRVVAPHGFKIMRQAPAEYGPRAESDPCRPAPEQTPRLVLRDVRQESRQAAVVAGQVEVSERDGNTYVRVPNGGMLIEQVFSFRGVLVWFAAFLTLAIFSFMYDDNPIYKFSEHLFVGVSAAYWMVIGFWTVMVPNLMGKLWPTLVARINPGVGEVERSWLYLIPLVFGLILLMRLSRRHGWISRWSLAFIVGTTAGLNFVGYLASDFVGQIEGAMGPLVITGPHGIDAGATFSAVVLFIGVLSSLVYFFFSSEHKGVMGLAGRLGVWFLMITFGASFGYTVMGRVALLVGRMEFIFADWLNVIIK